MSAMQYNSSNVNEVTRAVLNLFFTKKYKKVQKAQTHIAKEKQKRHLFMRIKNIYEEESRLFAYVRFCAFYAFCACKIFS